MSRRPVRNLLDPPYTAEDAERVHRRLQKSLEKPAPRRWTPSTPQIGLVTAAAVFMVGVVAWQSQRGQGPRAAHKVLEQAPVGPLADAESNRPFGGAQAEPIGRRLRFDDGSSIQLGPATELEVPENSGEAIHLVMSEGEAFYEVVPNGPRSWTVDAGWVSVAVVGTGFRVTLTPTYGEVFVERGRVVVTSSHLTEARRLIAGETLRVSLRPPPAPSDADSPPSMEGARRVMQAEAPWRRHMADGDYHQAYRALSEQGLASEVAAAPDAATLLAIADAARLSGHSAAAIAPLERLVAAYPQDQRAALASFTLGRIQLESLGRPQAAAVAFERALVLGLPPSLEQPARQHLTELRARVGPDELAGEGVERNGLRE
ncbi:MAG: FecR family protein [Myxococcota bacterium]